MWENRPGEFSGMFLPVLRLILPLRIGMQVHVRTARLGDETNDVHAATMTFIDFTAFSQDPRCFFWSSLMSINNTCMVLTLLRPLSAFFHFPVALRANRIHHILPCNQSPASIQDELDS